jgi:hypothetical protein
MQVLVLCAIVVWGGAFSVAHALSFSNLMETLTNTVNAATGIMLAAAFAGFFWMGVRYMHHAASDKRHVYMTQLLIGLVVLFAVFSVWGIVAFLADAIFYFGGSV